MLLNSNRKEESSIKILFDLGDTGWEWKEEALWALPTPSINIFQLDNIPLLAYGISQGDIFRAELSKGGNYFFKEVVERGGHSTFRINFKNESNEEFIKNHLSRLDENGCSFEGNGATLFGIDVPPEVSLKKIIELLVEGEELGFWDYEEGYVYEDGRVDRKLD